MKNKRLLIHICKLFYEERLSQKDIAGRLSISRPQISRVLDRARREGWVSIHVHNPYAEDDNLEERLAQRYGLRRAVVVGDPSVEQTGSMTAAAHISRHGTIGIMSGKSVFELLDNAAIARNGGLSFVSLVGGMGAAGAQWHANYMTQRLAEKTGGRAFLLHAPLLVQNERVKKVLLAEDEICRIMKKFRECEVIFAGIGRIDMGATLAESGILGGGDIAFLKASGAAAAAGCAFFGKNGEPVENELTRRFIGIGYEDLAACPNVVAAAFGIEKTGAIAAALKSSLIHELVTDSPTARGLLDRYPKGRSPF
jgi:DNA-binding transcriptional regulator LsrR (DeoR family)